MWSKLQNLTAEIMIMFESPCIDITNLFYETICPT